MISHQVDLLACTVHAKVISEGSRPTLWPRELKRWSRPKMNLVQCPPTSPHRRVVRPRTRGRSIYSDRPPRGASSSPLRYVEHDTQLQPWKSPAAAEPVFGGTKSHVHLLLMEYYLRLCVKRVGEWVCRTGTQGAADYSRVGKYPEISRSSTQHFYMSFLIEFYHATKAISSN
jgi:hypothetical protein